MRIDWESQKSHVAVNPRAEAPESRSLPPLPGHIWVATSGTHGRRCYAALAKFAFLCSAAAVNSHLGSTKEDLWAHALPNFHVGGLAILARAHLSGASLLSCLKEGRWSPELFFSLTEAEQATLSALVPAQVHDLVALGKRAPPSLRAVVVGGGALSFTLYKRAIELNWPLLPSYGLTECASQVATARPDRIGDPSLWLLPHVQAEVGSSRRLSLSSGALLTCYCFPSEGGEPFDPKEEGRFETEDLARLEGGRLCYLGRADEIIKVGGEKVNLFELNRLLGEIRGEAECYLTSKRDLRLGALVALVAEKGAAVDRLIEAFNGLVLPFERIRHLERVDRLEKTALQKIVKCVL